MYKIKIGKSKHILSDMLIAYNEDFSKEVGKPIYTIKGKFDLVWEDISSGEQVKSLALQKMSIIGGVEKLKNFKHDVGELKMEQDDKTLTLGCRAYLKDAIRESKNLRKKLSFSEHKKMFDLVEKMTLREMLSVIFHNGKPITEQEEGKTKKALKYGGAGAAGAYLGRKYLPKAIKKVTRKLSVPLVPKGRLAVGAGTAMAALYLWRRLTDRCRKGKSPKEVHLCKAAAAQAVINDLKKGLAHCPSSHNPKKCEFKIRKRISKWTVIYRLEREKAARPLQ